MIKKSLKYLLVISANLAMLTILLAIWTDFIEVSFNSFLRPKEFLKIIGCSLLSLLVIRMSILYFRNYNFKIQKRILISVILTLTISSPLYVHYSQKIYENCFLHGAVRKQLDNKIKPAYALAHGIQGDNLTLEEYRELTRIHWFPQVQEESDSISFFYTYEMYLPDYSFNLSFKLPKNVEIDSVELIYGKIKVEAKGDFNLISYRENEF